MVWYRPATGGLDKQLSDHLDGRGASYLWRLCGACFEIPLKRAPPKTGELLGPDLSFSPDYIFRAGHLFDSHGATGVNAVGVDAARRADAEGQSVGEARRGVPVGGGAVDERQEAFGDGRILSDNGVGETGVVAANVADRFIKIADHLEREDEVEILGAPVFFGSGPPLGHDGTGFLVGPYLNAGFGQPLCQCG